MRRKKASKMNGRRHKRCKMKKIDGKNLERKKENLYATQKKTNQTNHKVLPLLHVQAS